MFKEMEETKLLQRAREFEPQALAEIYEQYSAKLYRYALRLLGEASLAEDCVAETFHRLLTAFRDGKGPQQNIQPYLYRIAHNWIMDRYRRQPIPSLSLDEREFQAEGEHVETEVARRLTQERTRAALLRLTPDQRQVVMLKYYEDWENEAIAEVLQKPVGAVKSLQHRALAALRRILTQEEKGMYEANLSTD